MARRYEVQTWTELDGWVNCWSEDGKPVTFEHWWEAEKAIDEHLSDLAEAVADGHVEDAPDRSDFMVVVVRP